MVKLLANGCFDGVHQGHINFLLQASKLGLLYVGLNTDRSVKKLKGEERPLMSYNERRDKLFNYVEGIIRIFPIDNDEMIIMQVRNKNIDFIVKGSDTLSDKKYNKVIGSDECHGVIYIEHHVMDIHTKDYFDNKIPKVWKGNNGGKKS
jgi:cytidyltransferase-like protein